MTPLKPFAMTTITDGLRKDLKPISTPEDSFETLEDMYTFRGRVRRRNGYTLLGRLSFSIIDGSLGNFASPANPTTISLNIFTNLGISEVGQNIIPGKIKIVIAAPASYTITESPFFPGRLIASPSAGFIGGTINYLTGDLILKFSSIFAASAATITMFWAVNRPAVGLRTRELTAINAEDTIGFDTKFAYRYSNTLMSFQRMPSTMEVTWSGSDSDFFYTTNFQQSFWVTNNIPGMHFFAITGVIPGVTTQITAPGNTFQVGDPVFFNEINGINDPSGKSLINGMTGTVTIAGNPFTVDIDTTGATAYISGGIAQSPTIQVPGNGDGIRYYDGTTFVNFAPPITANEYLKGALLLVPYRGYFIALNTVEGTTASNNRFAQRCRYSQLGTAYYTNPVPSPNIAQGEAWRDDIFGRGGAIDASTNEQIIGAEFVRDILVVYFERSTWKLRFTQNSILPFVWERVNIELGAESTFSLIPFDKGVIGVGSRGIVTSDANSTIRIDAKIPDEVFDIENDTNGPKRVHGIRTYPTKLVYWTFPNAAQQLIYPNRFLVWNYESNTWAIFNDSFTCLGNWQSFNDLTWTLANFSWDSGQAQRTWASGLNQALYENVIGGNQQGFVEVLETKIGNDPSLVITNLTAASPAQFESLNHNIADNDWIRLTGISGILNEDGTQLNNRNYKVAKLSSSNNNDFLIFEFEPFTLGTQLATTIVFNSLLPSPWTPCFRYAVEISIVDTVDGSVVTLRDNAGNGLLNDSSLAYTGTINYDTGVISLSTPAAANDKTIIARVIGNQNLVPVNTIQDSNISAGVAFNPLGYYGGGYITRINGINAKSKFFNFFKIGQKARLSKVDFYTNLTTFGEFTCNIYGDSNTSTPLNRPFPQNLRSNVVLTRDSSYLIPDGSQKVSRLFAEVNAQTFQIALQMTDQQLAHPVINQTDIDIPAIIFWSRPSGRLI